MLYESHAIPDGYSMFEHGGINPVKTDITTLTAKSARFEFSLSQWSIAVLTTKASKFP